MFYVSLLKDWRTTSLKQDDPAPTDDEPEVEEPYEIEKVLRLRNTKRGQRILKTTQFYGKATQSKKHHRFRQRS